MAARNLILASVIVGVVAGVGGCNKSKRSKQRATAEQCARLAHKHADLATKRMHEGDDASADPESNAMREIMIVAAIKDMRAATEIGCKKEFSHERAACALAAMDLEAMANCAPTVDLRAKETRPSPDDCEGLGVHLESIYSSSLKRDGADAGSEEAGDRAELREVVFNIVANAVRECGWTMTKSYVQCQMKAQSLDALIRCAPNRVGTSNIDAVIQEKILEPLEDFPEPTGI